MASRVPIGEVESAHRQGLACVVIVSDSKVETSRRSQLLPQKALAVMQAQGIDKKLLAGHVCGRLGDKLIDTSKLQQRLLLSPPTAQRRPYLLGVLESWYVVTTAAAARGDCRPAGVNKRFRGNGRFRCLLNAPARLQ